MKKTLIGMAVLSAAAGMASAANFTMTFDTDALGNSIAEGANLTTQYSTWGVSVATSPAPPFGAPTGGWATNTSTQITATDIGGGVTAPISGKLLHSFGGWLNENDDPFIRLAFSTGIDSISANFGGVSSLGFTGIYAYNGATQVGNVKVTATGTSNVSLSGVGTITDVILVVGDFGDWVGVDNVKFNTVPAPSAAALLGLGALAAGRRRR